MPHPWPTLRPALCAMMCAVLVAGCASFPQLDRATASAGIAGPTPQLLPVDQLLAQADVAPRASQAMGDALAGRAARLRARADLMRGPDHNPETRARLAAAIRAGQV